MIDNFDDHDARAREYLRTLPTPEQARRAWRLVACLALAVVVAILAALFGGSLS